MITETTRRVLWKKFIRSTDKYGFLVYVQSVCEQLHNEMFESITDALKKGKTGKEYMEGWEMFILTGDIKLK